MIYETKGLTLEQVDELYAEVSSARKSVGWYVLLCSYYCPYNLVPSFVHRRRIEIYCCVRASVLELDVDLLAIGNQQRHSERFERVLQPKAANTKEKKKKRWEDRSIGQSMIPKAHLDLIEQNRREGWGEESVAFGCSA
jgi:hypothetical protein